MGLGWFSLSGGDSEELRLKDFTSVSKGTRTTIRITLETDDLSVAGYALRSLADVQRDQKAAARKKRPKPLMLPAPEDL